MNLNWLLEDPVKVIIENPDEVEPEIGNKVRILKSVKYPSEWVGEIGIITKINCYVVLKYSVKLKDPDVISRYDQHQCQEHNFSRQEIELQ